MESWQDLFLTAGNVVLWLALLPSVFSENKPALSTSLLTGSILLMFSVIFATLELWFSSAALALVGATWFVLAVQKMRQPSSKAEK